MHMDSRPYALRDDNVAKAIALGLQTEFSVYLIKRPSDCSEGRLWCIK